jgi:uncharacterized protein
MKQAWVIVAVCLTLLALGLIGSWTYLSSRQQENITVTGTSKKLLKPDRLLVTMSMQEVDLDQSAAVSRLDTRVTALKTALTAIGIDAATLEQGTVSVTPYYDYSPNAVQPEPGKQKKQVTQNINLRLDQSKVGELASITNKLTIAIAGLVPGLENYSFSYDFADRDKVSNELRTAAVENAKQKAINTLSPLNAKAGKIVSISDSAGGSVYPVMPMMYDKTISSAPSSAPGLSLSTSPQEQEVEFSVTVTFQIEQKKSFGIF